METNLAELFLSTTKDKNIKFFLERDSIRNLDLDLSLSINKRYKCAAGCEICFLKKWIPHEDYKKVAEESWKIVSKPEWMEDFMGLASNFRYVTSADDLYYFRQHFPDQYNFFKENAGMFSMSSFTDSNVLKMADIMLNDLKAKEIYEMTLSTRFIIENMDILLVLMREYSSKYNIKHIKIVRQKGLTKDQVMGVQKFIDFLKSINLEFFFMFDISDGWDDAEEFPCAMYAEDGHIFHLLHGPLYMAADEIYIDMKDHLSVSERFKVCNLSDTRDGLVNIIPRLLDIKIQKYRRDAALIKNKETKFYEYFDMIGNTLKVNYDFNFIPFIMLQNDAIWLQKAIDSGEWIHLDHGLIKKGTTNPISVIEKR